MPALDPLLTSLGKGGRDFERLCKWLLENAPEYRSRLEKVWLWDEWPGRWGSDAGIDLVARERDGSLWAIQAKHYDPIYAIKKADIDSFLSESSRPSFSYRLLIATTDHVGSTARRTLAAQEKPVGMLLRSQLDVLDLDWPSSATNVHPTRPVRKRPRPHQRRAIRDCVKAFETADRGQLVMACGTGKTLVGALLAEKLGARRVLVLVPSLSLLSQTLREWATATDFDYLAVCSDDTVTKDERDAVVAFTSELGIPVTTDPERVRRFLRRPGNATKVVFATYQSSPQIAAAQRYRVPGFDLVIADEAHRCAGPQAGKFATVLDASKIKARKRLFMTATPRYFTGRVKREAKEADWEIASMDEDQKFGTVLHRLTFAQAIDQDLLSDYQVVVVGVTDAEAHDLAARGAFITLDGETVTDARTLARQIGLLRSMAKYDLHRVVTFHSRIDGANRFASSLLATNDWLPAGRPKGTLWTDHVSGKMTAGERDARLRRLKTVKGLERGVLTNARCLTEGVDVPTLDAVAFIDPRRSQIDVVQAVGRAIRKAENKALGTIVIPVLVEEHTDSERALESSEFDRVWQIVRALRDHDDDLAEEVDELRRELGRRGTTEKRPRKIVLDLPIGIDDVFARAFDAKLVESASASWEFWFGLLERFVAREGHARVPAAYVEDGFRLGQWVAWNRLAYGAGHLSPERTVRLDALPGWVWNAPDSDWEDAFTSLEHFATRERHARVDRGHVEDGFRLGQWVQSQRHAYRTGKLSTERIARLEGLPGWVWNTREVDWEEGFASLERYVTREGHARVHRGHVEDGFRLGQWVKGQRRAYRSGVLGVERIARLEAVLGWTWKAKEARWDDGLVHLTHFASREGHTRVPQGCFEDGYPLGAWVSNVRGFYAARRLSARRVRQLEELPGWVWHGWNVDWERRFSSLERFVVRTGTSRVPSAYTDDGLDLGKWVVRQRSAYRRGKAPPERIVRLEALPGWTWDTQEAGWEEAFTHLLRFVEREGTAQVPYEHFEDTYPLGRWVVKQRQLHDKEKLRRDRVDRLEAVAGWVWHIFDARWEAGMLSLHRFVAREGTTRVPAAHVEQGFPLGRWVRKMRSAYGAGRLSAERVARLEALSSWVWSTKEANWEEAFARLNRLADRSGTARTREDQVEEGFALGMWARKQRRAHVVGRLSAERVALLEALPGWVWNQQEADWEEGFSHLSRFVECEGTARVPFAHIHEGYRLGKWVAVQRSVKGRGRLTADRIARFEALPGWVWNTKEAAWEEGLAHLTRFVTREGTARVPHDYVEDGFSLGQWVRNQRGLNQMRRLSTERIAVLETVPGWVWNTNDANWEAGFHHLEHFRAREGTARVPMSHIEDGYPLGHWARIQRKAYVAGRIAADRTVRLAALPGWVWDARPQPKRR